MPGSFLSQFLWLSLGYQRFSGKGSIWTSRMRKESILLALQSLCTNTGVPCLSCLAVSLIKGCFLIYVIVLRWGWCFCLYFWLNILEINPCKSFWTGINLRITAWIIFFFRKSIIFLYKGQNVLEYDWNNIFYPTTSLQWNWVMQWSSQKRRHGLLSIFSAFKMTWLTM